MPCRVLLISVGGASAPQIFSINKNRPEKIIFFVSAISRKKINEDIIPGVIEKNVPLPEFAVIQTPDCQHVGESVRALLSKVPEVMTEFGLEEQLWPDVVDYTGGTKTMSASIIWASAEYPCRLSYIGSPESSGRDKDGLGIVINGNEKHFLIENPWDKIAYFEARKAMMLFNRAQYANAAELLESVRHKVSGQNISNAFRIIKDIFQAFAHWDVFDHKSAKYLMDKNLIHLSEIADAPSLVFPGLKEFSDNARTCSEFLSGIKPGKLSWSIIWDLLGNAQRRAWIEHKYEDAVARCYSAIEKIAKYELKKTYGIDNSRANPEQIPEALRKTFIEKYTVSGEYTKGLPLNTLQFGVIPSFNLLKELDSPFGEKFSQIPNICSHLTERNSSILGHGFQPMAPSHFENLFNDAVTLMNGNEKSVPEFPCFSI